MIIVIAMTKGGIGKSSLAINLMYYLNKYRPILVNLDIQNSIIDLNSIRKLKTEPMDLIQATNINSLENIYNQNSPEKLFIIDTIGTDTELTRTALLMADLIISPVSDKTIDLLGLMNFHKVLEDLSNKSGQKVKSYVLINNVSPIVKKFDELRAFITSADNFELFNSIIRQRADISNAVGNGLAVGEYNIKSKAHQEFLALAEELTNIL